MPGDFNASDVWMLEEGHCLTQQFVNYCKLETNKANHLNRHIKTGSLETLVRLAESHGGITLIPELAAQLLDESRRSKIRKFKAPVPVRQISLITYRPHAKKRLNDVLKSHIIQSVTPMLKHIRLREGKYQIVGF